MADTAAARRRFEGAVYSRVLILLVRAAHAAYHTHSKGNDHLAPELVTAMAIRIVNERRRKAAFASDIAKITGFPVTTIDNHTKRLVKAGLIVRARHGRRGYGYSVNPDYPGSRVDARHIRLARNAIIAAGRMLAPTNTKSGNTKSGNTK